MSDIRVPEGWIRIKMDTDTSGGVLWDLSGMDAGGLHVIVAYANAALPDSDPRKITRDRLENLRFFFDPDNEEGRSLIAALESYLS